MSYKGRRLLQENPKFTIKTDTHDIAKYTINEHKYFGTSRVTQHAGNIIAKKL